jgi:hypothetical protein
MTHSLSEGAAGPSHQWPHYATREIVARDTSQDLQHNAAALTYLAGMIAVLYLFYLFLH